jgi:hypothetical protein
MTKIPPDILQPTLWNLRQRTRGREARSALAVLASSPHDLSTPLRMPTGAMLALSHSAGLVLGDTTIDLSNGASFSTPAIAADVVYKGIWAEQGLSVSVTDSPTGVMSLHYIDPLDGVSHVIGTLTVA